MHVLFMVPARARYFCISRVIRPFLTRACAVMPESKKGRITREIQKYLALAGSLFSRKKGITLIYAMWGIDQFLFRVDPRGDPNRPTCPYVGSVAREELWVGCVLNRISAASIRKGEVSCAISLITKRGKGGVLKLTPEEYTSCTEDKAPSKTCEPRCTAIYKGKYVDCSCVRFRMRTGAQSTSNHVWKWIELNPLQFTWMRIELQCGLNVKCPNVHWMCSRF